MAETRNGSPDRPRGETRDTLHGWSLEGTARASVAAAAQAFALRPTRVMVRVVFREWVPTRTGAVDVRPHDGRRDTARVLDARDGFEVGGIDARTVAAEVVQFEAVGDRAAHRLVDHPMGAGRPTIGPSHRAVAVREGTQPGPAGVGARGGVDQSPGPPLGGDGLRGGGTQHAAVLRLPVGHAARLGEEGLAALLAGTLNTHRQLTPGGVAPRDVASIAGVSRCLNGTRVGGCHAS